MIEALEIRRLCSSVSLTDGVTRNTSGIEWSSDRTLTIHGTRRSEALQAIAFTADQMGETIVRNSPSINRRDMSVNESNFTINLIRNLDGQPGGFEQYQFTEGTDAVGLQLSLRQSGAQDGVLIQASRRGVVERWIVRRSLVDRIVIDAGAGDDFVGCGAAFDTGQFQFGIPSLLLGGAGDDHLTTHGDATLSGGAGNDMLITTGAAHLTLFGGRGDDYIEATDPDVLIDGGAGFDWVNAMAEGFAKTGIEGITQP